MENITLGQIVAAVGVIAALIGGGKLIINSITDGISKIVKELLEPITESIGDISERLDEVDMETCKNFLVRCIADMERGENLSETEKERFHEQYSHYLKKGGNTYIQAKVEKLKADGKL